MKGSSLALRPQTLIWGRLRGRKTKVTERTPKTQIFAENRQIFADSPLLLEIQALGGHRKPQKTEDFRRKPKIVAENRRKPQIGLRHLRCVTFSSALNKAPTVATQAHGCDRAGLHKCLSSQNSEARKRVFCKRVLCTWQLDLTRRTAQKWPNIKSWPENRS